MDCAYHLDKFFNPSLIAGNIELIQIGRMFCSPVTIIEKHLHLNWFELTIVTDGEGVLTTDGEEIPVKRGDIYLSFPAEEHAIRPNPHNPLKYDYVSFYPLNPAHLNAMENIIFNYKNPNKRICSDAAIAALVENAILEFQIKPDGFTEEIIFHSLHLIMYRLLRNFGSCADRDVLSPKQANLFCYGLMHYIDTHIFTINSLDELSKLTNYNYCYISKIFKKTTGQTLKEYYRKIRLNKANLLIKDGTLKISEIADLLNYSSVYAFGKAYKEVFKISPGKAKKMR